VTLGPGDTVVCRRSDDDGRDQLALLVAFAALLSARGVGAKVYIEWRPRMS